MTHSDLIELRADMLAQKLLVGYCLTAIARNAEDPAKLLDSLLEFFVPRLREAAQAFASPSDRARFLRIGTHWMATTIQAAKQNIAGPAGPRMDA